MSKQIFSTKVGGAQLVGLLYKDKLVCVPAEGAKSIAAYLNDIVAPDIESQDKLISALEETQELLISALQAIAEYDDSHSPPGICPYGCDTPNVAQEALRNWKTRVPLFNREYSGASSWDSIEDDIYYTLSNVDSRKVPLKAEGTLKVIVVYYPSEDELED